MLVAVEEREGTCWRWLDEAGSHALRPSDDATLPLAGHCGDARVLAYRPFRRLCVGYRSGSDSFVEKGYRRRRSLRKAHLYRLAAVACGSESFRVLPVREHRPETESLLFDAVEGRPLTVVERSARDFRRVGAWLRSFQASELHAELPLFSHEDELGVLSRWHVRVSRLVGALPPGWLALRHKLDEAAAALGEVRRGLSHRDLHDGQVLETHEGLVLLDFDMLSSADVALDPANLLSHLELRALQGARGADIVGAMCCAKAFRKGLGRRHDEDFLARLTYYRTTSLLRLALVYRLRPPWAALSLPLTRRAEIVARELVT